MPVGAAVGQPAGLAWDNPDDMVRVVRGFLRMVDTRQ